MNFNQPHLSSLHQHQLKDDWQSPVSEIRKRFLLNAMNEEHTDSLGSIIKMLMYEEDKNVLPVALEALGKLGNKNTAKLVQVFLYFTDAQIQLSALKSIDKLSDNQEKLRFILPFIENVSETTVDLFIDILSKYGSTVILEHLRQNIISNKPYLKHSSLRILKFLEGESVLKLLLITVVDPSRNIKLSTLDALSGRTEAPYNHMINRLAQDPDIEVSEAALKVLNAPSPIHFQRHKIEIFDKPVSTEHSADQLNQSFESEHDDPVSESVVETHANNTNSVYQNISQIDESIDEHFLALGQKVFSAIKSGISAHPQLTETFRKIETVSNKLQTPNNLSRKKGIVTSVKKVFSGNLKSKMNDYNREFAVEEAYIELGEQSFDLMVNQEWDFSENDSLIMRIQYLFQLRKEKVSEDL